MLLKLLDIVLPNKNHSKGATALRRKKTAEPENKLHTEYGVLSNSLYILGKIKKYRPKLLLLMAVGAVTGSLMSYLWSFISKFVLDLLETPGKDTSDLIRLLIIVLVIELVSVIVNTVKDNRTWFYWIYVRTKCITERTAKSLSMSYQMLEQPDILDMQSKAKEATGGNSNGVEGLMHNMQYCVTNSIIMLVTLSAIVILDWRLILILIIMALIQFAFFRYTVKKDKREIWDKLAKTWRKIDYMERTTQDFDYAKDIRLFGMKNWLSGKQHEILAEKQERILKSNNFWLYNSAFAHGVNVVINCAIYGILIFAVIRTDMSIGDFTLYIGLCQSFTSAMNGFLGCLGDYKQCSLQVDDFRSFMDLETENEDGCIPLPKTDKYIFQFKNVSFKYPGQDNYAVKNLNLTLEAGKRLAVVGLNGAGKTTFIKLLLRLYDVTEGEILLNGINIKSFKRMEYYSLFSPVFQNIEIFAFPISENVSMKRPEETDKELSTKCLEQAGLKEKLNSLTNGVDTELLKVLHDDGIDLSGGEKQKLALARALYKNSPIIVLDEPTAALDPLAEYELYKSFDEIIADKSAVYISHRLSSTRFCDSIAMFREGELIEQGKHEELLEKGGAYAEMFHVQAQYYQDKEVALNV